MAITAIGSIDDIIDVVFGSLLLLAGAADVEVVNIIVQVGVDVDVDDDDDVCIADGVMIMM
jgi:hypothetical protein